MLYTERTPGYHVTLMLFIVELESDINHLPGSLLSLSHPPFSMCILSSSCASKAEVFLEFHCHLSPLSVLFGRRDPGHQVLPLFLSFLLHQVVPGVQSFPDCPDLLWSPHVHHGQVPQENPAYHVCREYHLFLVVHRNTMKEAVVHTGVKNVKLFYSNALESGIVQSLKNHDSTCTFSI